MTALPAEIIEAVVPDHEMRASQHSTRKFTCDKCGRGAWLFEDRRVVGLATSEPCAPVALPTFGGARF